jgi:putative transcriptional regulator
MADVAQILRSKNLATKFQIMVEVAAHQPNIQQKDIAPRLGITSQAVSEYIRELIKDGWLSSEGRSRYRVTNEGVDWILQMSRQLHSYAWFVSKAVADISTTTAIAVRIEERQGQRSQRNGRNTGRQRAGCRHSQYRGSNKAQAG